MSSLTRHTSSLASSSSRCASSSSSSRSSHLLSRRTLSLTRPILADTANDVSSIPTDTSLSLEQTSQVVPKDDVIDPSKLTGFEKDKLRAKQDGNGNYQGWTENAGLQYKWPTPGKTNWLGGGVPYPSNPYFKPSPPLSCDLQAEIYDVYTRFRPELGQAARIQLLTDKYSISKDRIRGIIKTGQVGEVWKKLGKPIQAPFARGMEAFLCVPPHDRTRPAGTRSSAMDAFPTQLSSRIDLDRDIESDKVDRGEIPRFNEHLEGFRHYRDGERIGTMSWEFAEEGRESMKAKMELEKPLKPVPKLPVFANRLVSSGKEAVWNFVDVKNKFVGAAWDGLLDRKNHESPARKGGIAKYAHLIRSGQTKLMPRRVVPLDGSTTSTLVLGSTSAFSPKPVASARPLTKRDKDRAAYVRKQQLKAEGKLTPTQALIKKITKEGRTPTFRVNEGIMDDKRAFRVKSRKTRDERFHRERRWRKEDFSKLVRKAAARPGAI